jgi:hypothetical protein
LARQQGLSLLAKKAVLYGEVRQPSVMKQPDKKELELRNIHETISSSTML